MLDSGATLMLLILSLSLSLFAQLWVMMTNLLEFLLVATSPPSWICPRLWDKTCDDHDDEGDDEAGFDDGDDGDETGFDDGL